MTGDKLAISPRATHRGQQKMNCPRSILYSLTQSLWAVLHRHSMMRPTEKNKKRTCVFLSRIRSYKTGRIFFLKQHRNINTFVQFFFFELTNLIAFFTLLAASNEFVTIIVKINVGEIILLLHHQI